MNNKRGTWNVLFDHLIDNFSNAIQTRRADRQIFDWVISSDRLKFMKSKYLSIKYWNIVAENNVSLQV